MQFNEAVYEYLNDKQNGRKPLRPNTLEGYMSAIKCHLMPKWSGREMESVTADELQAWVDSFERPGAAAKAFNTYRQIHRWYLRKYRVRIYDETQSVELPKHQRRKPSALTAKQANLAMRDMRGEEWEPCALIQLSCGLRPCEAIALTWADVNLSNGEVSVTKGLHEAFGEVYESPTKTEKSTRTVVLPRYAVERLRDIRRERGARRTDRLCCYRPSKYRRHVRAWFAKRKVRMCAHARAYGHLDRLRALPCGQLRAHARCAAVAVQVGGRGGLESVSSIMGNYVTNGAWVALQSNSNNQPAYRLQLNQNGSLQIFKWANSTWELQRTL